jgi:hypothetical protein
MIKSNIFATIVIGMMLGITLISNNVFSQENDVNLTEFRDMLSNTTYNKE